MGRSADNQTPAFTMGIGRAALLTPRFLACLGFRVGEGGDQSQIAVGDSISSLDLLYECEQLVDHLYLIEGDRVVRERIRDRLRRIRRELESWP